MADEKNFDQLLNEAPMATNEGTTTLVGALQRSREAGKFVLALGSGRSVTLSKKDVKEHHVLGSMIGQPLVQVTVDSDKVPNDIATQELFKKNPLVDVGNKAALSDHGHGGVYIDPYWGQGVAVNPNYGVGVPAGPFVLSTAHQAPAAGIGERFIIQAGSHGTPQGVDLTTYKDQDKAQMDIGSWGVPPRWW